MIHVSYVEDDLGLRRGAAIHGDLVPSRLNKGPVGKL